MLFVSTARAGEVEIVIASTTDVHGNVLPEDGYLGKPDARGLAKLHSMVRSLRRRHPDLLLVDCGDLLQGSPLAHLYAQAVLGKAPEGVRGLEEHPNPLIASMNVMGYDVMVPGNHDFNYGRAVLDRARREARFPMVACNLFVGDGEKTLFPPYVIREIAGVRVGIVGVTNPGVPVWERPENIEGLRFEAIVPSVRRAVETLRRREGCAIVVVLAHSGPENHAGESTYAMKAGRHPENRVLAMAREVPGIDVIFCGHTHVRVADLRVGDTVIGEAGAYGQALSVARIRMRDGRRRSVTMRTYPVSEAVRSSPEVLAAVAPHVEAERAYFGSVVGRTEVTFSGAEGLRGDSALVDLIHRVQLEATGAELSAAAVLNAHVLVKPGPLRPRDVIALYPFENYLHVLEVTGAQVKAFLEQGAKYWTVKDGRLETDPLVPHYNCAQLEGVDYVVDPSRPVGSRISGLRRGGRPVAPDDRFTLAVNSYRASGGGGFSMLERASLVRRLPEDVRGMVMEHVLRRKVVREGASGNWRLVLP